MILNPVIVGGSTLEEITVDNQFNSSINAIGIYNHDLYSQVIKQKTKASVPKGSLIAVFIGGSGNAKFEPASSVERVEHPPNTYPEYTYYRVNSTVTIKFGGSN